MYMKFDWNLVKNIIKADEDRIRFVWAGFEKDWEETKFVAWQSPGWACDVLDWEDGSVADTNCDMPSIQVEYRDGSKTGLLPVGKAAFPPEAEGERDQPTMAMKTPTPKATETTTATTEVPAAPTQETSNALAAISGLNLFNIPVPVVTSELFPMVKIPYPIELSDQFPAGSLFRVGLFDGKQFTALKDGSIFSVIAAKEASRKLTTDAEGKKVYERAYASMGDGFGSSAPLYSQHCTDPMAERGVSYVVAIIQGEGVVLAEIPAFKVMKDFWGGILHQARLQNGMGVTIKNTDVTACQTAGKKDPTKKYLDPKKFNSPTFVSTGTLPIELLKLAGACLEDQKDKFLAWCKR